MTKPRQSSDYSAGWEDACLLLSRIFKQARKDKAAEACRDVSLRARKVAAIISNIKEGDNG